VYSRLYFFKGCGEVVGLRWLTRQGTEEFRVSILMMMMVIYTMLIADKCENVTVDMIQSMMMIVVMKDYGDNNYGFSAAAAADDDDFDDDVWRLL